jgi:hypothetical protein
LSSPRVLRFLQGLTASSENGQCEDFVEKLGAVELIQGQPFLLMPTDEKCWKKGEFTNRKYVF